MVVYSYLQGTQQHPHSTHTAHTCTHTHKHSQHKTHNAVTTQTRTHLGFTQSLCYGPPHTTQRLLCEWSTSSLRLTCSPAHSLWLDHIPSPKHPIRPYNWHMQLHTWMEAAYNVHTHMHVHTICLYITYTKSYMYTLLRKLATKWIV